MILPLTIYTVRPIKLTRTRLLLKKCKDSIPDIPNIDKSTIPPWTNNHRNIIKRKEKVLFIQCTTRGTTKEKWYLIQVYIESTLKINPLFIKNGIRYFTFLVDHINNKHKSN